MAVTGISLGDFVLDFLADTTQFDQAVARINAETAANIKPSGDAVDALGKSFTTAGTAAAAAATAGKTLVDAFNLLPPAVQASNAALQQMAVALRGIGISNFPGKTLADSFQLLAPVIKKTEAELQNMAFALRNVETAAVVTKEAVYNLGGELLTASGDVAQLTGEMAVGANGARELGEVMTLSGERIRESMYEARGEIGLLGEATGVTLPRHVRSFLAELPGVGAALSAAFEATAVLFLIQALVEGAHKLEEFISSTFIFTENMKAADEIVKKSNADLAEYSGETKKLKDAFELLGKDGIAKTGAEMQLLKRDIDANNKSLETAKQRLEELNAAQQPSRDNIFIHDDAQRAAILAQNQKDNAAEIAQANAEVLTLNAIAKENQEKLLTIQKQGAIERRAQALRDAREEITAEREKADSFAQLKQQENRETAATELLRTGRANEVNAVLSQIDVQFQVDLYNNRLQALQRTLALDKTDKSKDPEAIKRDNENIENLQRDHAAALIKIYADTIQGINNLSLAESGNRTGLGASILGSDFQDKFQLAEHAAEVLSIQLSGSFSESADKAKNALDELKASGVATAHDLIAAETQLTIAQVNNARATGQSAQAVKNLILEQEKRIDQEIELALVAGKDITELQRSRVVLEQLDGTFRRGRLTFDTFFRDLARGALTAGQAIKELGQLTAEGIGASVTAAVNGSQSFGQAMEQLLKSTLASLAGIAITHAIEEVAKAFSDFATAASMAADPFTAALAPGFVAAGNAHLIAAVKWGAVGAGAAIAGAAVPGGSSSQESGGTSTIGSSSPGQITQTQPEQNPVQTVNTQRLGGGGLITQRTLAVIGDAATGSGSQREAVIPVDDPRFMDAVAGEISRRIGAGNGVVNNHYWTIEGMISGDNLHKVAKKISSSVNKGSVRFNASNSLRITRRG